MRLSHKDRSCTHTIFVVLGLRNNLLGYPAIRSLQLFREINSVDTSIPDQYPALFTGLGTFEGEYTIKIKPNAQCPASLLGHTTECTLALTEKSAGGIEPEEDPYLDAVYLNTVEGAEATMWSVQIGRRMS